MEPAAASLREWVRLDSVEGLLRSYEDRLDRQERRIALLEQRGARLVDQDQHDAQLGVRPLHPLC